MSLKNFYFSITKNKVFRMRGLQYLDGIGSILGFRDHVFKLSCDPLNKEHGCISNPMGKNLFGHNLLNVEDQIQCELVDTVFTGSSIPNDKKEYCFKFTCSEIEVWRVAVATDDFLDDIQRPLITMRTPYKNIINDSMIIKGAEMESAIIDRVKQCLSGVSTGQLKVTLLFRGTRDKFSRANFAKRCQLKQVGRSLTPMMFLIRADNGRVFGGFTLKFDRTQRGNTEKMGN